MKINAQRLEVILAKRNMTMAALAEASGISRQNISTIKNRGTCKPCTVGKLAAGLNVSIEEITGEV